MQYGILNKTAALAVRAALRRAEGTDGLERLEALALGFEKRPTEYLNCTNVGHLKKAIKVCIFSVFLPWL
jgi:hypothetical protein